MRNKNSNLLLTTLNAQLKNEYIYYCREKIMQLEQRIADSNRSIVEAEFKLQKFDAECKKLQVKIQIIHYFIQQ